MADALNRSGARRSDALVGLRGDRALAARAADGSEAAFATIFKRHHQALFRYAMSILGNRDDARDVVQETMVSLLRSLPGETREIELRPWLFRIARNEAISLRRRRREIPLQSAPEPVSNENDPGERVRAHSVLADLAELPERQRSAIVMRELNGLSYPELGVALGISAAAAKQAVYEGRCALQELEQGREMACDEARRTISAHDRRRLRGRKLRAHIRSCGSCREFERAIAARRRELGAIAALPAATAAEVLGGVLGSAGGAGAGGLGLLGAGATLKAALGGAGAAKLAAGAAAATVAATVISIDVFRNPAGEGGSDRGGLEGPAGGAAGWGDGSAEPSDSTSPLAEARHRDTPRRGEGSGGEPGSGGPDRGKPDPGPGRPDGATGPGTGPPADPGAGPGHGARNTGRSPAGGSTSEPPGQPIAGGKDPAPSGAGGLPAKSGPSPAGLDKLPGLPKLP